VERLQLLHGMFFKICFLRSAFFKNLSTILKV